VAGQPRPGLLKYSTFTSAPGLEAARLEMETNYAAVTGTP
jgi:hypothetical protein